MTSYTPVLLLALLTVGAPLAAQPQQQPGASAAAKPSNAAPFVPDSFDPPTSAEGAGFKLVPLGPKLTKIDFDAYMSSIDHLQKTFTRSKTWPRADISQADAVRDMDAEQGRFQSRKSFAYAVLTPDGSRERGSVYISPSPTGDYDAVVRMWVTKNDYDAGFDARLYAWVNTWVKANWPFRNVVYPGRSVDWRSWDAMIAKAPPKRG